MLLCGPNKILEKPRMVKLGFILDTMDWICKIPVRSVESFTTDSHEDAHHYIHILPLPFVKPRRKIILAVEKNIHVFAQEWRIQTTPLDFVLHARIERDYLAKMSSRWTTATTTTASVFDIIIAFQARWLHTPCFLWSVWHGFTCLSLFLTYQFNWYLLLLFDN